LNSKSFSCYSPEIAAQLSNISFGTSTEIASQDHSKSGGSRKLTSLELGTRLSSQKTRSNSRASIFMFSPTTTEINIDDKTTEYSNPQETVSATLSKVEEEQIAYTSFA
jgi:hypothetical protein